MTSATCRIQTAVSMSSPSISLHARPWTDGLRGKLSKFGDDKRSDNAGIMTLYESGMTEAIRILKPGGLLLVKCKDEIESGQQRWNHIVVYDIAVRLDMTSQDLFMLTQKHDPWIQRPNQKHARKNHSYMWVFKRRK